MAETKLRNDQLYEVAALKREFRLSVGQCCYWLERQYDVYISRKCLWERFDRLDMNNLPVHVSTVLKSIGITASSR